MFRALATAAILAGLSLPASAQTVCGERDKFLTHLSSSYSEAPAAVGLISTGAILEVLTSTNGSWTIIVTRPNGVSCVMASGEAWQDVPKIALGPPA